VYKEFLITYYALFEVGRPVKLPYVDNNCNDIVVSTNNLNEEVANIFGRRVEWYG